MSRQRWPALMVGCLGFAICLLGMRLSKPQSSIPSIDNAANFIAPLSRLEPRLIELLFIGRVDLYQAFLASWVETKMASSAFSPQDSNQIFASYDVMAHHQPRLEWFYLGPCLVFSERLNRPDLCFSISGYGQKAIPTSWKIPLLQSFIEAARLGRSERARYFLQIAANKPGAPEEIRRYLTDSQVVELNLQDILQLIGELGAKRYQILTTHAEQGNL